MASSTKMSSKNTSTNGFTSSTTPTRHQRPVDPGDPEREAEAIRSKKGIPLIKPVVDDLLDISRKTGIPFEAK